MAYAVVIYFDEISEQPILNVWSELEKKNILQAMNNPGIRPHITLAIYDSFNCTECEKEIRQFAKNFGLLSINADHFGIFPLASPVIFIAPAPNRELMNFQKRIHRTLKNNVDGSWEMYQPGNWIPHLTLVRDIKKKNLPAALEICMKIELPLELQITQIGVVNFEPVRQIFEIDIETN
jgi:2'-5' RNA ligase